MDPATIAALALCLLASVIFSITDSALTHFSRAGLDHLADEDERERLRRHLERRHRYQLVCFSINAVANIVFVILLAKAIFTPERTVGQYVAVVGYAFVGILVVGEVIPRAWGRGVADRWLHRFFPVLHYVELMFRPLTAVLQGINALIGRLTNVPMDYPEVVELSDEIRSVVSNGDQDGVIEEEEREMIASIFELQDRDVGDIMTPRTDVVCIEADATVQELRTLAVRCGYSRIPVFDGTRDHIIGIVHVKDLLEFDSPDAGARQVVQAPTFVPETKRVAELLQELRAKKVHMAIVLDEYGGTAGIVTLEDVVEEIVGEIEDEYDEEAAEPLVPVNPHTAECAARLPIDDLNDALGIRIPEDESYDTVGGFVVAELGHIPAKGETFPWRHIEFTILDATDRRIRRLRVTVHPEREDQDAE
ncbi:MAG: hemolysin family protein [Planctomycetota bacterium]